MSTGKSSDMRKLESIVLPFISGAQKKKGTRTLDPETEWKTGILPFHALEGLANAAVGQYSESAQRDETMLQNLENFVIACDELGVEPIGSGSWSPDLIFDGNRAAIWTLAVALAVRFGCPKILPPNVTLDGVTLTLSASQMNAVYARYQDMYDHPDKERGAEFGYAGDAIAGPAPVLVAEPTPIAVKASSPAHARGGTASARVARAQPRKAKAVVVTPRVATATEARSNDQARRQEIIDRRERELAERLESPSSDRLAEIARAKRDHERAQRAHLAVAQPSSNAAMKAVLRGGAASLPTVCQVVQGSGASASKLPALVQQLGSIGGDGGVASAATNRSSAAGRPTPRSGAGSTATATAAGSLTTATLSDVDRAFNLLFEDTQQVAVVEAALLEFLNGQLAKLQRTASNLDMDLRDGVNLICLVAAMTGKGISSSLYAISPENDTERTNNIKLAFVLLLKLGVDIGETTPLDVLHCHRKETMRLLYGARRYHTTTTSRFAAANATSP